MILNDLDIIAKFLADEVRFSLQKTKKGGGALEQSIKGSANSTGLGFEINVFANDYFKFIDQGVNGSRSARNNTPFSFRSKKPPLEPILSWVRRKGIESGSADIRKAAFAIQMHIFKNGIKGVNILDAVLTQLGNNIESKVADSAEKDISIKLDKIIKDNGFNN